MSNWADTLERDNAFLEFQRNKGLLKSTDINHFQTLREEALIQNKPRFTGVLCLLDILTESLIFEDFPSGRRLGNFALGPGVNATKETWAQEWVLTQTEDSKYQSKKNFLDSQGLLVTSQDVILAPFFNTDTHLLSTYQWKSPWVASEIKDTFDMLVSPCREYLFVIHRFQSSLSVFSLNSYDLIGQIQIGKPGNSCGLNLALDTQNQWAYITDNQSQNIYLLEYPRLELKSFKTNLGILGSIALCPIRKALYYTRIKPKFGLGYLDLNTLEHIKDINTKGTSFQIAFGAPNDLLTFNHNQSKLFFITAMVGASQSIPVMQVIDLKKVKTVARYALKEIQSPLLMGSGIENPLYKNSIKFLILNNDSQSTTSPESQFTRETPSVQFHQESEEWLLQFFKRIIEKKCNVNLTKYPFVVRKLRVLAWETCQTLEQELECDVPLEFEEEHFPLGLKRSDLLHYFAKIPNAPHPLFTPIEKCPICGFHWENGSCSPCDFSLYGFSEIESTPEEPASPPPITGTQISHLASDLLDHISFLNAIPYELKAKLSPLFQPMHLNAGELLIKEKEMGATLFFIVEGQFSVSTESELVATLAEGDVVGEIALLFSEPRSATVKAKTDALLLRLEGNDFRTVIQSYPQLSKDLKILAHERKQLLHQLQQNKQNHVMDRIKARMAVDKLKKIHMFANAPDAFFQHLAPLVKATAYMPLKVIFKQGDQGRSMYFISKGAVDIIVNDGEFTKTLHEGEIFGEMSLFLNTPRSATVKVKEFSKIFELSQAHLYQVLDQFSEMKSDIQTLVNERQDELANQNEPKELPFVTLPRMNFESSSGQAPYLSYFFSALENAVFNIESAEVAWHFHSQTQWRLFQPYRCQTTQNALYILDSGNDRIFKLDNQSKTIMQTFGEPKTTLSYPRSIDGQSEDLLLIADEGNQRLLVINSGGENLWEYGPNEWIVSPFYAEFTPEGNILYADAQLHIVREINHQGDTLWQYGIHLESGTGRNHLFKPSFAHRLLNGQTLIADKGNHRMLWISSEGQLIQVYEGSDEAPLIEPMHCQIENQGLYIFSESSEQVICVDDDLELLWYGTLLPS